MQFVKRIALASLAVATVIGMPVHSDPIKDAMKLVEKHAGRKTVWDGPTSGPKAAKNKTIVVLAADMKNGGVLGVTTGVQEAVKAIGWRVRVLDGGGSVSGRTAAFGQAMALKPDGIIINGFDAVEQQTGMAQAREAGIPMVSWHATSVIGPDEKNGIFSNVSTDPMIVSDSAAQWAFADAGGKPGVVIFTDSTYQIAIDKADRMKEQIEKLGGTVLEYVDTPIADTSTRMGPLTTTLLQKYGKKWTHSLAINDIYFDFMGPALAAAGIKGNGSPKAVAAGDGSQSAYQRIRAGQYQAVTVAEPLNLQGWQLVDELNRALNGVEWSGYTSPLHVVTADNIAYDGGPDDLFDPQNNYRKEFMRIWK
jgi:ribose transport system substrate-binding protein